MFSSKATSMSPDMHSQRVRSLSSRGAGASDASTPEPRRADGVLTQVHATRGYTTYSPRVQNRPCHFALSVFAVALLVTLPSVQAASKTSDFKVGQVVEVNYKGKWTEATIRKMPFISKKSGKTFVFGLSDKGKTHIYGTPLAAVRPMHLFHVGEEVEMYDKKGGEWHKAIIRKMPFTKKNGKKCEFGLSTHLTGPIYGYSRKTVRRVAQSAHKHTDISSQGTEVALLKKKWLLLPSTSQVHKVMVEWKREYDPSKTGKFPTLDELRKRLKSNNVYVPRTQVTTYLRCFKSLSIPEQYQIDLYNHPDVGSEPAAAPEFKVGDKVQGTRTTGGKWFDGEIKKVNRDGTYFIEWNDAEQHTSYWKAKRLRRKIGDDEHRRRLAQPATAGARLSDLLPCIGTDTLPAGLVSVLLLLCCLFLARMWFRFCRIKPASEPEERDLECGLAKL